MTIYNKETNKKHGYILFYNTLNPRFKQKDYGHLYALYGQLMFGGLYSGEDYIQRAFCVSICLSRLQNLLSYQSNIALRKKNDISLSQIRLYYISKPT